MAPQATPVVPVSIQSSVLPSAAAPHGSRPSFIPLMLFIFLGLCLAYTLSYVLYRIIMARRHQSEDGIPESADRGVSRFMNGARLTLDFGNTYKSTPLTTSESPNMPAEEKPLAVPPYITLPEVPTSSPAESSPTPFIILTPSLSTNPDQELGEVRLQEEQGTVEAQPSVPSPVVVSTQRPPSEHVSAKVLSQDRVEAIALDPKLAPVQGPLRPLSMVPSPTRKRRTLFGLGLKHVRGHGGDSETASETR